MEPEAAGAPFRATVDGPAYAAMSAAMEEAFGVPMATLGQGGSIPRCNVFADTYPDAEIILMGVEEPRAMIHAPNESVDPGEIASMALGGGALPAAVRLDQAPVTCASRAVRPRVPVRPRRYRSHSAGAASTESSSSIAAPVAPGASSPAAVVMVGATQRDETTRT